MLVEMNKQMLTALVKGCNPSYEIMDHPLIASKGYFTGGHYDRWTWNNSFGNCTEQNLWETYQLLQNPIPHKENFRYADVPCSINELYLRLGNLHGVEYVYIVDHYNLSVSITVIGGSDIDIARVLAKSLASCVKTLGDYQVCTDTQIPWKFNIYRTLQR